jgi:hypothetical protein
MAIICMTRRRASESVTGVFVSFAAVRSVFACALRLSPFFEIDRALERMEVDGTTGEVGVEKLVN